MINPLFKTLMHVGAGCCVDCTEKKCLESEEPYLCPKLQKAFGEVMPL